MDFPKKNAPNSRLAQGEHELLLRSDIMVTYQKNQKYYQSCLGKRY